jgi:hypothetical protein
MRLEGIVPLNDQVPIARIDNQPGQFQSEPVGGSVIVKFHARESESRKFHNRLIPPDVGNPSSVSEIGLAPLCI